MDMLERETPTPEGKDPNCTGEKCISAHWILEIFADLPSSELI